MKMTQCSCGGSTTDHEIVRNKVTVGIYAKCHCGRWMWRVKPENMEKPPVRVKKEGGDGAA